MAPPLQSKRLADETTGINKSTQSERSRSTMASSDASDARSSRSAISATPKSASPVAAQFFSWDAGVTLAAMLLHAAWIASVARESYGRTSPFASISVLLPFTASMGYALLVFLGPRIMRNRKPLSMSGSMFVYNVYQCLFNAVVVVAAVATILLNGFRWWGIPLDLTTPAQTGLGIVIYLHYSDKFLEFFDSLVMILRKKDEQLSFLHCWHHFVMPWVWFYVLSNGAGGDAYFGAMINSFIHVVMYHYYAATALGISVPWKRQLTNMQMVQFVLCAVHGVFVVYMGDAHYPRRVSSVQIVTMVQFFALFALFYQKEYIKKPSKLSETTRKDL